MVALSLMAIGCTNDDLENNAASYSNSVLTATMEQENGTRSLVDDNGSFTWATGDQLAVYTTKNKFVQYTLQSGDGTGSGTFSGALDSGESPSLYAVYPYSEGHKITDQTLTLNLPAEYGDFDTEYAPNTHAAMVAEVGNDDGNLQFKHVGGVIRFQVDNVPVDAAQFVFTEEGTGSITGDFELSDKGSEKVISRENSGDAKTVTIKFKQLTDAQNMTFYVPLPVGGYQKFKIAIKKQNGSEIVTKSYSYDAAKQLNRKTLALIPKLIINSVGADIEEEKIVTSDVEASTTLNEETGDNPFVNLIATNAVTNFSLPESFTSGTTTNSELNINYSAVPSSITITESGYFEGASVNESKGRVNISIPASQQAPNVTIQTPVLTAGLYATDGGITTYGEVTATTASNTLIVGDGVTINKLTIKGGNVRVKGNAKITELVNSTNDVVYVIKEGTEASVPNDISNVEVVDAATYDLMMACANGGSYTLTANVTGDFVVSATEEVLINLNGYTVTNKVGDTFTVNNGSSLTISGNGTVDNVTHQRACIYNNGTVVLNGGTYTRSQEASTSVDDANGNSYYNILNHGEMTINAGVTISSTGAFSSLIDNGYYSYTSTNERTGYVEGKGWANPSLKINGGSFSGGINTIKNDDGATLTITDGTFANTTQATVQNNHVATISGGVYNPTSSATDAVQTRYFAGGNNAGQTTISGGIFNGKMYVSGESASLQISGGTFSDPSALTYLTDGANVKVALAKDVVMSKSISLNVPATVGIDLSKKKLSFAEGALVSIKQANVTFSNGYIEAKALSKPEEDLIVVGTNGTVTLDGVELTTNGSGIGTEISEDYSKIVVENSKINVTAYAISTNATNPVPNNVVIELSGSEFTGSDPLLLNIPANISIDGCTMNGTVHGMVLRGGTATVKNSTITLNYPDNDYEEISSYFDDRNWGSGNMINVAALTIGNKSTGAYQYPTEITLENTTVQSIGDHASYFPALYAYANSGVGLGVTLTYDEQCIFTGSIKYGSTNITVNGKSVEAGENGEFVVTENLNE